jgi:hypothetical protein
MTRSRESGLREKELHTVGDFYLRVFYLMDINLKKIF